MSTNEIKQTADGSHTLRSNLFNETYHSTFGAVQESRHIFIDTGLDTFKGKAQSVHILEIGFGTGLNALLSMQWAGDSGIFVNYLGIEAYPVLPETLTKINYPEIVHAERSVFEQLHTTGLQQITPTFQSQIIRTTFQNFTPEKEVYDLVFFDAFSPETQPEMWTTEGFHKLYLGLKPKGVLVTYSSKGMVKRALKEAGFTIEKIPGPPGKREFIRAMK